MATQTTSAPVREQIDPNSGSTTGSPERLGSNRRAGLPEEWPASSNESRSRQSTWGQRVISQSPSLSYGFIISERPFAGDGQIRPISRKSRAALTLPLLGTPIRLSCNHQSAILPTVVHRTAFASPLPRKGFFDRPSSVLLRAGACRPSLSGRQRFLQGLRGSSDF